MTGETAVDGAVAVTAAAFALGLAAGTLRGERARYAIGRYLCLLRSGHEFGGWRPYGGGWLVEVRRCRFCTAAETRRVYPTGPLYGPRRDPRRRRGGTAVTALPRPVDVEREETE